MDQISNQDQGNLDQPRSEEKLTLKIVKFTEAFKEDAFFRFKSCNLHNLAWFLFMTVEKHDNSLFLGYKIKCKSPSNLWTCHASVEIKILNGEGISKEHSGTFFHEKPSWGISKFITMSEILKKGLLVNDTLHLEATIKADSPRGIISMIQPLIRSNTELQDKFAKMLEDNMLTDIEFQFQGENYNEIKTLKAHKFVLSLASEKLKKLFHEHKVSQFKIMNMTYDCFEDLLRFIYYKDVQLEGKPFDEILNLYSELHNFEITDGVTYIQYYLQSIINNYNKNVNLLCVLQKLFSTSKKLHEKFLMQLAEALIIINAEFIACKCDLTILTIEQACSIFLIAFEKLEDQPPTCFDALNRYFVKSKLSMEMFSYAMESAIEVINWTEIGFENILNASMFMDSTKLKILRVMECLPNSSEQPSPSFNLTKPLVRRNKNKRVKINNNGMKDLYEHTKSQDCTFKFGTGEIVKAHKAVLAMNSEVFEGLFCGEARNNQKILDIVNIKVETFKIMLKLLYCQSINLTKKSSKSLYDLYEALHQYKCTDALCYVKFHIIHNRKEDLFLFYEMARKFSDKHLEQNCYNILRQPAQALKNEHFLNAKPETVNAIFTRDDLKNISDEARLKAIEAYIAENVENDRYIMKKVAKSTEKIDFQKIDIQKILTTNALYDDQKLLFYTNRKFKEN